MECKQDIVKRKTAALPSSFSALIGDKLMEKSNVRAWLKYGLMAILSSLIFCMNFDNMSSQNYAIQRALWNIFGALYESEAAFSLLVPVLAFFYAYSDRFLGKPCSKALLIFSLIVAFISVLGLSYYHTLSWDLVFSWENGQFIKALLLIGAYTVFLSYIFRWIIHLFAVLSAKPFTEPKNWYTRCLYRHTYLTVFLTLLPLYLLLLVVSYPALPSTDSVSQIVMGFSGEPWAAHHPVAHSAILVLCIKIGIALFSSGNAGLLLISLCQLFAFLFAACYAVDVILHRLKLPIFFAVFAIVYFAIHPSIQRNTFSITKDILYSSFYLCFLASIYLLLTGKHKKPDLFVLVFSTVIILLFRNESKYIVLLSSVVLFFVLKKCRKACLAFILAAIAVSFCMSSIIQPLFNIRPGSKREMLSIPFQQTARYLRDYPADVTPEEKAAIEAVLDYDTIAAAYNPNFSDPVKITFHNDASTGDLINYFKAWASMFVRHPEAYLQATINNYYQYFAFTGQQFEADFTHNSPLKMDTLTTALAPYGVGHPEILNTIRLECENVLFLLFQLPFLSLLMMSPVYTWTVIALFIGSIQRKNKAAFAAVVFPLVTQFMIMLGPCNGTYERYQYPIILSLPAILAMYISAVKGQEAP